MASQSKALVVVLGASGRQGGSTARQLLQSNKYLVRAVNRDITKPSMLALQSLGATLATASFDDPLSLCEAFTGASAIFANTTFTTTRSVEAETAQGKNIMDAAASVPTLLHLIWSGCPDVLTLSGGRYQNALPMKGKAEVMKYLRKTWPLLATKTTQVFVQSYFENWRNLPGLFGPIEDGECFRLAMPTLPGTVWPAVSIEDTGKIMLAIFENREKTIGKTIDGKSEALSFSEMLRQWGQAFTKPVVYEAVSATSFEASNKAVYGNVFGGEHVAEIFVKATTDQILFFGDMTTGKVTYQQDLVALSTILNENEELMSWKEYAKSCTV